MSEWISIGEERPDVDEKVLVMSTSGIFLARVYDIHKNGYLEWAIHSTDCGCCNKKIDEVTHWMRIPEIDE